MQRFRLNELAANLPASVLALGNFDGVHRGHQHLVRAALALGRETGIETTAVTFDPHPMHVLDPTRAPQALMTIAQKGEALEALGVSRMVVIDFTRELAAQTPREFASTVLAERLAARVVVAGAGFRFGRGRAGDLETLASLGAELGFRVSEVAALVEAGQPVSSTRIRQELLRGDVAAARALLGRRFANDGVVVAGDGRGRTLGVPTANLARENAAVPADGVYAAWCRRGLAQGEWGQAWPGAVSIGYRPTFTGTEHRLEAHLMGFSGNLYGATLRIEYESRLREERRFEDEQALVAQIHADIDNARDALGVG